MRVPPPAVALLLLASCHQSVPAGEEKTPSDVTAAGRVRPPEAVPCPRDRLTSYAGRVSRYERREDRTQITIETDWETTEDVVVDHPGGALADYLIEGAPFTAADWPRIESRPGVLLEGMRAIAWVCEDPPRTVIDWRPGSPAGE